MARITQENREIKLKTPLGDDVLLIRTMSGYEELGKLFEYQLELVSDTTDADFNQLIGDTVTVSLEVGAGRARYFNGHISRFAQTGISGHTANYQATVVPWFWFLTQTSDCRIFQNMTVPDIIKDVFREAGYSDFEDTLSDHYREWVNCVQYRESDFNFINRLMEQEGIYYFFKHEEDKHTLVLADSYSSHEPVEGYEEVSYHPPAGSTVIEKEHLYAWEVTQQLQPGAFVYQDFDFTAPKKDLLAISNKKRDHAKADLEIYDYPGEYKEFNDGDHYSRVRLEEIQANHQRGTGHGDARGLSVGGLFTLTDHPREDQNIEYLIVSAGYKLTAGDYGSGGGGADKVYTCEVNAINAQEPFRPLRTTPRPWVQGPQTAIVVGPSGEEIWTDEHGRVKVQFHWDRYGEDNENSSCWIRVSQVHAGKGFGGIDVPRIGEEVIVSFLEGDPDRPIITGRVYNGSNKPPNGLPAAAMISGMKTNSTPGGGGDNTIMLDDTKGNELIRVHGQFDMDTTVDNDLREHVLNNRSRDVAVDETISIGNNRTEDVGNDETTTIGNNRTETVGADETISIGSSRSVTIGSNKSETIAINKAETIGVAKELTIGGAYQVTVGAAMNETIGAAKAEEIGGVKSVNVGVNSSENIGGNKSVSAGKDISESAGKDVSVSSGKKMSLTAGDDFSIKGGKKGVIDIADELTIKCGKATIVMKKNGDITINGKKIVVKASGDIVMKGNKILQN